MSFYGDGKIDRYAIVSVTIGEIPPPPPVIKTGEREEILRAPKNGVKSEAYLERYQGGALLSRKRLREDVYLPTQGILVKKIENPSD